MTCEVAVMNKWGVALAADSAVTLGNGRKIFHGAQKLFCLSEGIAVGILTYGSAEIMGTPWEIIIKQYVRQQGGRRFERLDQYATDFLQFIETAQAIFPADLQKSWFISMASAYWDGRILDTVKEKKATDKKRTAAQILKQVIKDDHEIWAKYDPMDHLGPGYGERVIDAHRAELIEAAKKVFDGIELNDSLTDGLLKTVQFACTQQWVHPADRSGIVIAGMGESERFPRLLDYMVGALVAGKLRYYEKSRADVSQKESAIIVPLAQREVMDGFITGLHPDLRDELLSIVRGAVKECGNEKSPQGLLESLESEKFEKAFFDKLFGAINKKLRGPLMDAVDALPRQDLATMAEALVNLTVFKARITADQVESVGGPIDVGLISKGDGFVWVKKKD